MFREIILLIFRSTRLCVTVCGIMHPRCCRPVASFFGLFSSQNIELRIFFNNSQYQQPRDTSGVDSEQSYAVSWYPHSRSLTLEGLHFVAPLSIYLMALFWVHSNDQSQTQQTVHRLSVLHNSFLHYCCHCFPWIIRCHSTNRIIVSKQTHWHSHLILVRCDRPPRHRFFLVSLCP